MLEFFLASKDLSGVPKKKVKSISERRECRGFGLAASLPFDWSLAAPYDIAL